MQRILLIEDDHELAQLTKEFLEGHQFHVDIEGNGASAVERIIAENPDLVILDLMLPGKDGISICREARFSYSGPILMLTASMDKVDQILGLEIGADDYVQKPIEPRVLLARIRAVLRRVDAGTASPAAATRNSSAKVMSFDKLQINKSARAILLDGVSLDLSNPEYDLLVHLAENAGEIVSRDTLFRVLKNFEYDGQNRFIDITMSQIRKKLGEHADVYLKTVRGKGYLFIVSVK